MGNVNGNEEQNNNANEEDRGEILIHNENQNIPNRAIAPSYKKVIALRNPFSIKKNSLILEKDAGKGNKFYIKFTYDSLVDFHCYINFNVSKNSNKPLNPKNISDPDKYILAYKPSDKFTEQSIVIKNLPKGSNMEFFEEKALIDIDYFKENTTELRKENYFDVSIELVPVYENEDLKNQNEIVFVSLCNLEQNEELERHPHSLKIEEQKLKTFGMWIDIHDIYNTALDNGECPICCTAIRNTIFLPCRHACTCNDCANNLKMRNSACPICKIKIKDLLILEVAGEKDIDDFNNNDNNNIVSNDLLDNNFNNEFNGNNNGENIEVNENIEKLNQDDEEKLKIKDEE